MVGQCRRDTSRYVMLFALSDGYMNNTPSATTVTLIRIIDGLLGVKPDQYSRTRSRRRVGWPSLLLA